MAHHYVEKPKQQKKETKDFAFGVSFTELLMSLGAGVGGAFVTAANKVTEIFDKDQKNATAFKEHRDGFEVEERAPNGGTQLRPGTQEEWRAARQTRLGKGQWAPEEMPRSKLARLNAITLEGFKKEGKTTSEYWSAVTKEKAAIYKDYLGYVERVHGIGNKPILGTIQRFRMLSPGDRKSLILPGTIGATIGTAMTLGFFNGMVTREKINKIDDAVQSDVANQPDDQKPLAFKDRKPLPPKALPKNDDKTADHAEKVAAEAATGKPVKDLREKYEELKEERPVSHVERVGEPVKEEHVGKPASHVEKLAAAADAQDLQVAAR